MDLLNNLLADSPNTNLLPPLLPPLPASPPAPLQGERGVKCHAAIKQTGRNKAYYSPFQGGEGSEMPCSYKANEKETKHTTPLSPWRGAGGEAGGGCV